VSLDADEAGGHGRAPAHAVPGRAAGASCRRPTPTVEWTGDGVNAPRRGGERKWGERRWRTGWCCAAAGSCP
jgi:hypothetical protein